MSLKRHLFKPKWQHRDPQVRREAVTTLNDPELLDSLFTICLKDEDPAVRAAAARRVSDLGVLLAALDSEQDEKTGEVVRQRMNQLTASTADDRPSLESRKAVVEASFDRHLLEQVAANAPESELRRTALAKTDRQGYLGDRAVQDPDPEIRRLAGAAITQLSTLRRVIDDTRKSDKALHQELSERLHRELLESGDPKAVRKEAEALCARLESYVLGHMNGPTNIPDDIAAAWNSIAERIPPELVDRFRNIAARLESPPTEPEPEPPPMEQAAGETVDEPAEMPEGEPEKQPAQEPADEPTEKPEGESEETAVQEPVDEPAEKPSEEPRNEPADKPVEQPAQTSTPEKDENLQQAETWLAQITRELEEGSLHKALETRYRLTELGKNLKGDRRWQAISRQLSAMHGRIRELRDWQHWSNDKIRKELIEEMEILPGTDLHPDAILDRVKALQSRWKELEKSEQIPGDKHYHAAPWMWRKFSAAGRRAFEATKPYLEKRDEIRDRHLQQVKDLLTGLREAVAAESPDWPQLTKLLQHARREMRNLDKLPAKARKKMAGRLRKALGKGNDLLQDRYKEVEKAKLKLVREAAQLTHLADRDEAIRTAKRLQAEWKAAGSLWRRRENELWKAFREPLDPLFGKLKAEQESAREEIKESLAAQERLCKNLEEILKGDDELLLESRGKIKGLRNQWRDIERPNPPLRNRFHELVARFDKRLRDLQDQESNRIRQGWWNKAGLLHQLENALLKGGADEKAIEKCRADWPVHESGEDIDRDLDARLSQLSEKRATTAESDETVASATGLCIQLEFLAGLPTPDKEKDQRMKYQVDRLSRSLSGDGTRLSADEEARIAEQEWLRLPVLSPRNYARFERRIKAALDEIYGRESV